MTVEYDADAGEFTPPQPFIDRSELRAHKLCSRLGIPHMHSGDRASDSSPAVNGRGAIDWKGLNS